MQRIILISNRLPVTVEKRKNELHYHSSIGGLATGLESFHKSRECLWIGWPGLNSERVSTSEKNSIKEELLKRSCIPIFLSKNDVEKFYNGFSNKTIWPLFHYFPHHTVYEADLWKAYVHVNELFAETVAQNLRKDDIIWIHDYQLMLLPSLLRKKMPEASIGFFLHIPFPSLEIFRLLPWRKEILEGLMGADLIGFHTYEYIRHFLSSVRRLLGCESTFSQISYGNRFVKADVFPMGIDYERFSTVGALPSVIKEEKSIRKKTGNRQLIIAIDRLDYTKGIIQRLEAFDLFLDKNIHTKENVTLILVEVPSRTSVDSYRMLKKEIDEIIGRINGKHGTIGWAPVLNLYRSIPFSTLSALYLTCDVALVTPLRDGMNLVAKEYVATKQNRSGVLILSEMAGAAREMGEAIIVNPNNVEEMATAIKTALEMDKNEQISRLKNMQRRLMRYDVKRWASDFINKLEQIRSLRDRLRARKLTPDKREELFYKAKNAKRSLFLLDYDGTLVSFENKPEKAIPDPKLLELLCRLNNKKENTVAVISGRDKESLQRWFGQSDLFLCAEHGVWVKEPHGQWATTEPLQNEWKNELRPILELFTDRTPGALLEEKDYSLAFHYRNADPELATLRVRELMEALLHLVSNLNLGIMEGNKVIEIKNAGINKGTVALKLLERGPWDLIVAIGDDVTDEYLFASLPEGAFSIKVGVAPSRAIYNVDSVLEVRELLEQLSRTDISEEKLIPEIS
jgi:trehalose 6-phosphate synthase/phosphatase